MNGVREKELCVERHLEAVRRGASSKMKHLGNHAGPCDWVTVNFSVLHFSPNSVSPTQFNERAYVTDRAVKRLLTVFQCQLDANRPTDHFLRKIRSDIEETFHPQFVQIDNSQDWVPRLTHSPGCLWS